MRIVVALGGNALLKRGEQLSAENQRNNATIAALSLAKLIEAGHDLIVSHGNGPRVGLLALQGAAYDPSNAYPLDVMAAETEGMVGYIIEQELENALGPDKKVATLLTQVEVSASDPAFQNPSKQVGPFTHSQRPRHSKVLSNGTLHPMAMPTDESFHPQRHSAFRIYQ